MKDLLTVQRTFGTTLEATCHGVDRLQPAAFNPGNFNTDVGESLNFTISTLRARQISQWRLSAIYLVLGSSSTIIAVLPPILLSI